MSLREQSKGKKNTKVAAPQLDPKHWLNEYGDFLYGYALLRLRDPAHAEDLVQETLLAALQARTGYTGRASEKTWLTGILKHKIIDLLRKQVRESTVDDIGALLNTATEQDVDELFDVRGHWIKSPRDWCNPHMSLENIEFIEAFQHCLGRLKPALASVFTLRELEGQTTQEICNELGISATNYSVMMYRARMGLRRCLEIRWPGGGQGESA